MKLICFHASDSAELWFRGPLQRANLIRIDLVPRIGSNGKKTRDNGIIEYL